MLNSSQQMVQLMINGKLVTHLHCKTSSYALYALSTFFVELEYLRESKNSNHETILLRKYIFKTGARLEKYLSKI